MSEFESRDTRCVTYYRPGLPERHAGFDLAFDVTLEDAQESFDDFIETNVDAGYAVVERGDSWVKFDDGSSVEIHEITIDANWNAPVCRDDAGNEIRF